MTFRPELEMSVTVRKIPFEYGKMISETLGAALEEIKDMARITDPLEAVESSLEIGHRELNVAEAKDAMLRKALEKTNGHIPTAAKLAGVSPRMMYRWVRDKGKETLAS